MESVGLLAGGIAHDFNNLLTTIIGNADFALDQTSKDTSLYSEIDEIRKAGRQAAALTRQLLAFSRKQLIRPEILNLNDILTGTEKMLRRTIGEDIEFKTMIEPELWNVKIDPGQIEQILLNLIVNARDAMPTEGKLTIETANVELDDIYVQNHGVKNGRGSYVMMVVTDTGIGMDEKTRYRIFEPFFTTKERGQGTGLGLSTVYGIVKQNNGHIRADSEPGKGTTFKIYLPRIKADEALEIEEQMDENRLKGSETILVVEDSKTLLKLTQKMLESYGYKVLTAQCANEAVEIFNGHDRPIHLLLTDVVMPGMSGRKLAAKIISKNPKVKVIYMSGYTDDTISKHGVLYDDIEFIEKPFSQKNMGLKVRRVLDAEMN
jgi:CheY-like chemotaxis protein